MMIIVIVTTVQDRWLLRAAIVVVARYCNQGLTSQVARTHTARTNTRTLFGALQPQSSHPLPAGCDFRGVLLRLWVGQGGSSGAVIEVGCCCLRSPLSVGAVRVRVCVQWGAESVRGTGCWRRGIRRSNHGDTHASHIGFIWSCVRASGRRCEEGLRTIQRTINFGADFRRILIRRVLMHELVKQMPCVNDVRAY